MDSNGTIYLTMDIIAHGCVNEPNGVDVQIQAYIAYSSRDDAPSYASADICRLLRHRAPSITGYQHLQSVDQVDQQRNREWGAYIRRNGEEGNRKKGTETGDRRNDNGGGMVLGKKRRGDD